MKLIVGLGNPGEKYKMNRHNVGHMFIDKITNYPIAPGSTGIKNCKLLKTDTFMNTSGNFVQKKLNFFKLKPEDLYIVHDDLDIPLGQYKIQFGIGPKVHNGVSSVEQAMGTKEFWRIRIGIDNRGGSGITFSVNAAVPRMAGEQYVLEDFTKEEVEILTKVFEQIAQEINQKT